MFSTTGKLSVTTYLPGVSMSLAHQIADPKPLGPWHSKTRVRAPNTTSQRDSSLIEIPTPSKRMFSTLVGMSKR
jgi:hypothetical protein